ncbi:MAG: adenine phosphoribosyltransferase [SAR202 cluster bacterium]|nr:adenine phosphoribosyltransferase [SAR202 cluster bacterium]
MKKYIRTIPDYPIKGVQFKDITTILKNSDHFSELIDQMTKPWEKEKIDAILSIESRGFIMAGAIAYNLKTAFIPLRKPDKLPAETYSVSYTLEYGTTEMHIHKDALDGHTNLLIIDDLLATGGTIMAAIDLIKKFNNKKIVGAGFMINLPELKGEQKLKEVGVKMHSLMNF